MLYLIDGYNLLFRSLRASEDDFKRVRENFIIHLSEQIEKARLKAKLIFDAPHTESFVERSAALTLPIIYTDHKQTADEYILEFVSQEKHPKEVTVVTSDSRLAWAARGKGAYSMSVEEFRVMLGKKGMKEERRKEERREEQGNQGNQGIKESKKLEVKRKPTDMERWEEAFQKDEGQRTKDEKSGTGIKELENQRSKGSEKRQEGLMTDMERWLKAFEEKKEEEEF